jgi:hypothetical protein
MIPLTTNPRLLVALALVVLLVVSINWVLFRALRNVGRVDTVARARAEKWGLAFRGAAAQQRAADATLTELRQRVASLQAETSQKAPESHE